MKIVEAEMDLRIEANGMMGLYLDDKCVATLCREIADTDPEFMAQYALNVVMAYMTATRGAPPNSVLLRDVDNKPPVH